MDIKQKDEVEINDANLKDFLEKDLKGLKFILDESKEFAEDLTPVSISKLNLKITTKRIYGFLDYYKEMKNNTRKKLTKIYKYK